MEAGDESDRGPIAETIGRESCEQCAGDEAEVAPEAVHADDRGAVAGLDGASETAAIRVG